MPQNNQSEIVSKLKASLVKKAAEVGIKVVVDYRYNCTRFIDINENQIGVIFQKGDDGKRVSVQIDQSQIELNKEIKSSLPADAVYEEGHEKYSMNRKSEYTFFPTLKDDEAVVLNKKAIPVRGMLGIVQGEYAIVEPDDNNVHQVGTCSIDSCNGALIHDRKLGRVAVTHVDHSYQTFDTIRRMKSELVSSGSSSNDLLLKLTDNVESQVDLRLKDEFTEISKDLPRDFLFDTRTGRIVGFDNQAMGGADIKERTSKKIEIRFANHQTQSRRVY